MPLDKPPADEELNFHYDRAERVKLLNKETVDRLQYSRKKRKLTGRSLIILLDVVLLVVLVYAFGFNGRRDSDSGELGGCKVVLSSFVYDGRVLVSLKVTVEDPALAPPKATATFSYSDQTVVVTELLPLKEEGVRHLRGEFSATSDDAVDVKLELGDEALNLDCKVDME